jgi:APA family basic amino acid/polyamine antiporter
MIRSTHSFCLAEAFVVNSPAMEEAGPAPVRGERRPVGALQLLALGVNGIVGVGIFFAPATVAKLAPGRASILAFAVTGLALVPVALAFAKLGQRFDEDGGPVVFARAAFGDFASFVVGWVAYVSAFLSASAVMVGLTDAVAPGLGLRGPIALRVFATVLVAALALVVASGIRISARVWTSLTVLKLLPLLALLAAFLLFAGPAASASAGLGDASWLRAGLTVMFTFQGFEIVPVIAGQVRSSARAIPVATVGSLLLAILLYVGLVAACVSALPGLASSGAPLAEAAGVLGGSSLARVVGLGTSISALGIALGMMVTTPHYLSALASGHRSLFDLERLDDKGVPMRALFVTWALVTVVVNAGDLGELFALSSIAVLMQFGVTAAALVALAGRRERGLSPLDAWPAVPTFVVGLGLVVFGATLREGLVAVGAVLLGLLLWRLAPARGGSEAHGAAKQ